MKCFFQHILWNNTTTKYSRSLTNSSATHTVHELENQEKSQQKSDTVYELTILHLLPTATTPKYKQKDIVSFTGSILIVSAQ